MYRWFISACLGVACVLYIQITYACLEVWETGTCSPTFSDSCIFPSRSSVQTVCQSDLLSSKTSFLCFFKSYYQTNCIIWRVDNDLYAKPSLMFIMFYVYIFLHCWYINIIYMINNNVDLGVVTQWPWRGRLSSALPWFHSGLLLLSVRQVRTENSVICWSIGAFVQ